MKQIKSLNKMLIEALNSQTDDTDLNSVQEVVWKRVCKSEDLQLEALRITKDNDCKKRFLADAIVFLMIEHYQELSKVVVDKMLHEIFTNYIDNKKIPMFAYQLNTVSSSNTYLAAILAQYDFDIELEYQEKISEYLIKSDKLLIDEIGFFLRSDIVYDELKEEFLLDLGKKNIEIVYNEWEEFVKNELKNVYKYSKFNVLELDLENMQKEKKIDYEIILDLKMLQLLKG